MSSTNVDLTDTANDVATSVVGRVAVALAALAAPVVAVGSAWLQGKIGINLDPTQITALIAAEIAGVFGVAYKWLHNRGEYEKVVLELEKLYHAGEQYVQDVPAPVNPQPVADVPPAGK